MKESTGAKECSSLENQPTGAFSDTSTADPIAPSDVLIGPLGYWGQPVDLIG